ncbi:ABC transporter permease [Lederbergia sp. NSJ-179]|uniref:FtsX-like permease family protein n=1 Tax=Lederbergia sp. NSJ-179 TaxID=2931402 RepID=UPI001FD14F14|nr:FtsX-like permease family protein [Lederbergia sp. NSJ-179]MCJ7841926.1 ABC transporter permease [Lederbergia sp. NSJ-179]
MVSKLWQLSLKMLLVKKGRMLFSILAIALGVGQLCSMFQLHIMFNQDLHQRLENEYGSADIRISSPPPTSENEWSGLDTDILEKVNSVDQIQSVGKALEGKMAGRILYENQSAVIDDTAFHYVGVDNEKVTKEYYKFKQDLSDHEVALSESLAAQWNVAVSDSIEIDLLDGNSVIWRVAEVVQPTQNKGESSENWIFFHLASLQEMMGLPETMNPILIELKPKANIPFIGDDLKRELPREVRVDALNGLVEEEEQYAFFRVYGYILSIIAFIASVLLVYNLMQTTYRERLKELAVIRAVGGSTRQLMKMVIYEWALIGAVGSFLGFILAWGFSGHGIIWVSRLLHLNLVTEAHSSGGIGMAVTAFVSWLAILLASLGAVRKVIDTDPVQSFRESMDSTDEGSGKAVWWVIFTIAGLLLWLVNYLIPEDTSSIPLINMKALSSMLGGLFLCMALLSRTVWVGMAFLRFITLLPDWVASRSLKLSAQRLMVEKSQLSTVILMALVIMVCVPVATVFLSTGRSASVDKAEYLNADFFVNAQQEFYLTSAPEMPWYLKREIEELEGVENVLPLPVTQFAKMNGNNNLDGSTDAEQALLHYVVTDLRSLVEWHLASLPDNALEDVGVLPKKVADELGIEMGDMVSIIVDDQPTSVVIVDITDKMDALPQHANALFIDESHPAVQPLSLWEMYVEVKDGYEEQMKQDLNLLQREYPEMRWGHITEAISSIDTLRQQILMLLLGVTVIIIICGTGGVMNAINAGIHARRRDYAVLRSVFLTPFQMMKMVAWQGVVLAILSIMMGSASATILLFSVYNMDSYFRIIFTYIPLGGVGILYLVIFILTMMATLPMAGKIARMKIMDVFKTSG